jgi:DNA-binding NtrC family response regulator
MCLRDGNIEVAARVNPEGSARERTPRRQLCSSTGMSRDAAGAGRRGPSVVAILNSNEDLVELMRVQLESAGFLVVSGHVGAAKRGAFDLRDFIEQHDPSVIVFDLVPPYDRNWAFLEHLRGDAVFEGRQFVLTSANAKHAESLAHHAEHIYEIIGTPYDLDQVVQAVREASRARPVR